MQPNRVAAVAVVMLLLLTPAMPVGAKNKHEVELRGVVVSLDSRGRAFMLQQARRGGNHLWMVRINGHTRIGTNSDGEDENEDEDEEDANYGLAVGDLVRVLGHRLGNGHIMAHEVRILGRANFPERPPFRGFPPVQPFPSAPQIFSPADGEEIATEAISVVGQTVPGAAVHVEVAFEPFGTFRFGSTTADTVADGRGIFVSNVRLPVGFPKAVFRITVTANIGGVTSPATSITVRHI